MQFDDIGKLLQGGLGNMNIGNIMEEVQKKQQEMKQAQEEKKKKLIEGTSGGGKVKAVINGHKQLVRIHIDPEVVDPDPEEVNLLEDMIVAAVNQAMSKIEDTPENPFEQMMSNFDINGMLGQFGMNK